ncbi:hypothetical protein M407DRAFT_35122 [Tulasnella calospora MUT 4182]|uniref:CBM1 domain-containing protein n=1 Tax=Tulasnella calospora MUT 4182 TaxID=1051891 RepID=A0A0C3K1Q7_9AGAM|nr:hypothetical protein M407DRAFT_35122 [Tulasnella calospora MUT 4182]
MLSLRTLIAIITTASLSSTVTAQKVIPNWGHCGGLAFSGTPNPSPCADGWTCTVANQYYWQCLPPSTTTTTTRATTSTTTSKYP